jgi:hypothetical protein
MSPPLQQTPLLRPVLSLSSRFECAATLRLPAVIEIRGGEIYIVNMWYSTFFVRVPPDIISLQLCTPKVVGV